MDSTVWSDLGHGSQFDLNDLEGTFTLENTVADVKTPAKPSQKKQNVATLLDINRANHTAIMLARIKMSLPDIRNAIVELDDNKLGIDDLRAMTRYLPTPDEVARIKDHGDVSKLAKADQYFAQIISIPRLSERLNCMVYRRKLELDIEELRPELEHLRNASKELRASLRFKRVLQAVLAVGNALNTSTFRGGAQGFQLDALMKLKDTKTTKGGPTCPTLLHYLARLLLRTDPSLTTFIDELPNLEAAARLSVDTIMQTVDAFQLGLQKIRNEIEKLRQIQSISSNDRFIVVMEPYVSEQAPRVEALKNMAATLRGELQLLLIYYGENANSPEAPKYEDFFGMIASFSSSLQKCALEVHEAEQRQLKAAAKLKPKKGPLGVPQARAIESSSAAAAPGKRSIGRGEVDQAIRSIRAGIRTAKRQAAADQRVVSKIFLDGGTAARHSRLYES